MDNIQIINSTWFNEMGSTRPIGIVAAKDVNTLEVKMYIGTGLGQDIEEDEESIVRAGAKFFIDDVNGFFTDSLIIGQSIKRGNEEVQGEQ